MKLYRDLSQLPKIEQAVLTIGSFDGVHQGHQHIIARLKSLAKEVAGETVLLTFDPHPRIALAEARGEKPEVRLISTLEEKAALLSHYGIDHLVVIPFTKDFFSLSPTAYIQDFLVNYFNPHLIVIGYDHRFGKGRVGDIQYLKDAASTYGYKVVEIPKHEVNDIAVSSTKVRKALAAGKVAHARKLLGHPYRLTGKVVEGLQIGRSLGFPTANLQIGFPYKLIPADGSYAVIIHHQQKSYKGMLHIGHRPTVEEGLNQSIEVHIFDFSEEIYEEELQIDFIQHLRKNTKFDSLQALQQQLAKDQQAALRVLASIETKPNV